MMAGNPLLRFIGGIRSSEPEDGGEFVRDLV